MREREPLVNRHNMGHTIARVEYASGRAARSIEREDSLDGDVERGRIERLEHDLRHLLAVSLGVHRCLGEEDGVLFGRDAQLVEEGMVPDLLHVVPVGYYAVLDGVLEGEDSSLGLGFVAGCTDIGVRIWRTFEMCWSLPDVGILLSHADHDALLTGTSHNRTERTEFYQSSISRNDSRISRTGTRHAERHHLQQTISHFLRIK